MLFRVLGGKTKKLNRIIILTVAWSCMASTASEIRWFQHHAPPMYNLTDKQPATGIVNRIIDFLVDQLPQHEMKRVVMTSKRFWHELQSGNNYCRMDTIKTPRRQQWTEFTIALSISPPATIVMHQRDWLAQGKPAELSLADLLNNGQYLGSAIATASFGEKIDNILQANANSVSFKTKTAKPHALLGMVNLRRLHYSVEFPLYVQSYLVKHPNDPLHQIKIQEEVDYYPLHIACTKNSWGESVVKDMNVVLEKNRFTEGFIEMIQADGQIFAPEAFRKFRENVSVKK